MENMENRNITIREGEFDVNAALERARRIAHYKDEHTLDPSDIDEMYSRISEHVTANQKDAKTSRLFRLSRTFAVVLGVTQGIGVGVMISVGEQALAVGFGTLAALMGFCLIAANAGIAENMARIAERNEKVDRLDAALDADYLYRRAMTEAGPLEEDDPLEEDYFVEEEE